MNISMKALKEAQLFSSHILYKTKPECTALTDVLAFPFITEATYFNSLKEEFLKYAMIAEDFPSEFTVLDFWKHICSDIQSSTESDISLADVPLTTTSSTAATKLPAKEAPRMIS